MQQLELWASCISWANLFNSCQQNSQSFKLELL
jgi:hypothetical protein